MPAATLTYAMLSDRGLVRSHNEDACAASAEHGVFVVCDGVGGASSGEVASHMAAEGVLALTISALATGIAHDVALRAGIEHTNRIIYRQAQQTASQRGMATTLVALAFDSNGEFESSRESDPEGDLMGEASEAAGTIWLANVGDSRCYRLQAGRLDQLTRDHSMVEEQVRSGVLTRQQADVSPIRNVITRAIGAEAAVEPDLTSVVARRNDLYLLCSDGLARDLSDSQILAILCSGPFNGHQALLSICERLVDAANDRGGGDNITCLLVRIR